MNNNRHNLDARVQLDNIRMKLTLACLTFDRKEAIKTLQYIKRAKTLLIELIGDVAVEDYIDCFPDDCENREYLCEIIRAEVQKQIRALNL